MRKSIFNDVLVGNVKDLLIGYPGSSLTFTIGANLIVLMQFISDIIG